MLFSLLAALFGGAALFGSIAWFLWQESVAAEQAYNVGLANSLGERTEEIFLDTRDLLDRIYDNGVVAWWPSPQTRVGGVELFLMRYGEHDVAIDPRLLLDLGPNTKR